MDIANDHRSDTQERRQSTRHPLRNRIRLTIDGGTLQGRTRNASHRGVLLVVEDDLGVTVEIEGDGIVKRVVGRLVRLERASGRASLAIEFDE